MRMKKRILFSRRSKNVKNGRILTKNGYCVNSPLQQFSFLLRMQSGMLMQGIKFTALHKFVLLPTASKT